MYSQHYCWLNKYRALAKLILFLKDEMFGDYQLSSKFSRT